MNYLMFCKILSDGLAAYSVMQCEGTLLNEWGAVVRIAYIAV